MTHQILPGYCEKEDLYLYTVFYDPEPLDQQINQLAAHLLMTAYTKGLYVISKNDSEVENGERRRLKITKREIWEIIFCRERLNMAGFLSLRMFRENIRKREEYNEFITKYPNMKFQ